MATSPQEIASLKRQFAELLSDIGFVKEELKARDIERLSSRGSDGILEGTGSEVTSVWPVSVTASLQCSSGFEMLSVS